MILDDSGLFSVISGYLFKDCVQISPMDSHWN